MKPEYRNWLERQKYQAGTITTQLQRAGRVEKWYGNLDEQYETDRLEPLIQTLTYSAEDQRRGVPNPSKIPIDGDTRANLASYRDAVRRYRKYRDDGKNILVIDGQDSDVRGNIANSNEELGQRIGLERDMQAALRTQIDQLESDLTIIDEGAERSVESGFIDITAKDILGLTVVIELKAGPAGQRAVAQILSYMGDIAAEDGSSNVRGILVASEFDAKAKAAARMVPTLLLRKYSVRFMFSDGHS